MKKYIVIEDYETKEMVVFYGEQETRIFFNLYLTASNARDISYFVDIGENDNKLIRDMVKLLNLSCIAYYEGKSKNEKKYRLFIGSTGILKLLGFLFDFNYLKFNDDVYDWAIGELCNIPTCCIEKWIEFADTHKMVDDYFHQLNGKKDRFNLKCDGHNNVTSDHLNFIPCSPHCRGSRIRQTIYKKLQKQMFDNLGVSAADLKKSGFPDSGEGVERYAKEDENQSK